MAGKRNSNADQKLIDKLLEIILALGAESESEDEGEGTESPEMGAMKGGGLITIKGRDGASRWLSVSSTAYQDADGEIVSIKALEDDVERSRQDGYYGPLRWQHVGDPDFVNQKAGPGLDVGTCDFATTYGKLLVESGTFKSEEIAEGIRKSGPYHISLGFFHPANQPDGGVYTKIKRFERSMLSPGRASNRFTSFSTIGGAKMKDKQISVAELTAALGEKAASEVIAQLESTEKSADLSNTAYKGQDFMARIKELFSATKPEPESTPAPEPVKEKTIAEMTPAEFKALMQPEPVATQAVKDDTLAAVKEAQAAQIERVEKVEKAVGDINLALKALLDELEALTGKPGYRPTQDAATVKATTEQAGGISQQVLDFLNTGGAK